MKVLVSALSLSLIACATGPRGAVAIERWNENHPEAARELCQWAASHPAAAPRFFDWDGNHPEKSQEFVTWTLSHPNEGIGAFVGSHPEWANFDVLSETHRPAANAFMEWARRHPQAAEDLMSHPRGLEWAGHHMAC